MAPQTRNLPLQINGSKQERKYWRPFRVVLNLLMQTILLQTPTVVGFILMMQKLKKLTIISIPTKHSVEELTEIVNRHSMEIATMQERLSILENKSKGTGKMVILTLC